MDTIETSKGVAVKITRKVRSALDLIVNDGFTPEAAAAFVGLKPHSLYVARRKPHVKRVENDMFEARRRGFVPRAWHEFENIALKGAEEKNRLTALINGLDRELGKPIQRVETKHESRSLILIATAPAQERPKLSEAPEEQGVIDAQPGDYAVLDEPAIPGHVPNGAEPDDDSP